jgi:hypothetical protein
MPPTADRQDAETAAADADRDQDQSLDAFLGDNPRFNQVVSCGGRT